MEIKYFFVMRSKLLSATFQATPIGVRSNNAMNLTEGNYEGVEFPIIFKQSSGKKLTDILDTGYANFYLISDRMKTILEKNSLTGWRVFLIKLYDKKGGGIFGYHGLSITGRCGPINYKKSEIIEKKLVPNGPICKFYKGLHIGLDKWDGTDLFLPEKTRKIVVTKMTADILKNNKITNMDLENLSDCEMDAYTVSIIEKRNDTN